MRRLTDWIFKRGPSPKAAAPRRRIDLGDKAPGFPIYAIGDVHGCLEQLRQAENEIVADIARTGRRGPVILLGDYVDRGPQSAGVLDHLLSRSPPEFRRICLCGNHDDIFSRFIDGPHQHPEWLRLGGEQTLLSYGIDIDALKVSARGWSSQMRELLADAIPPSHRDFLRDLPVSLRIGELLFVHAGLRPGVPLDLQRQEDMLWIREPFLTQGPGLPSLLVIHGHTPSTDPTFGPQRVGIDTGAFYSGKLSVLKIENGKAHLL